MTFRKAILKHREVFLLLLPAGALAFWAWMAGRAEPPFPLDEAHVRARLISQINGQLVGRSWTERGGGRIAFKKFVFNSILIRPQTNRIYFRYRLEGWVQYPKEKKVRPWLRGAGNSIMSREFGAPFTGGINIPGYGRVYLSIPGMANDPRRLEPKVRQRLQRGLCYHCGGRMSFFEKLSRKQRHDKCQENFERLYLS